MEPLGQIDSDSGFDGIIETRQLRRIATGLADQFELLYGAKPVDPRVRMAGNMMTFTFQGGLSRSDEQHLEAGHLDELRCFRERFLEVVADQLKSVASMLAGGRVTLYYGVFDPNSRTTTLLFILDPSADDQTRQWEAIRNWSKQVRRNAQTLRDNHLRTREAHIALRQQMREGWERLEYDESQLEDA